MDVNKIQGIIKKHLATLVLIFMGIQPLLDVLSYFLVQMGNNSITTALRFLLLAVVAASGFLLSEKKKLYFVFYGIAVGFWVLHVLNCFRVGYTAVFADTANYLRIISLPVYTLSFITFFLAGKGICRALVLGFAVNFGLVIFFTALPWLLGTPRYTYETLGVGVMGWFAVASAQSAIVALLCPITILFAYKTNKYPVYLLALCMAVWLMFYTGTKLTYYSVLLICAGFIFLFVVNLKKKSAVYVLPLFAAIALVLIFKGSSPMERREDMSDYAKSNYNQAISESLKASGTDAADINSLQANTNKKMPSYERLAILRRNLMGIYTDKDVYGKVYKDINDRFGVYNVMAAYNYTIDPQILSDSRLRKSYYAKMVWNEKDFITKLMGIEYSDMVHKESIYDLENDFPAIFYFCGYLGFGLYMLFFLFFALLILRGLWRYRQKFFSLEIGAVGITLLLALGAAQISGNVLRKPNVTAYCAVVMAYIFHLMVTKLPESGKEKIGFREMLSHCKKRMSKMLPEKRSG